MHQTVTYELKTLTKKGGTLDVQIEQTADPKTITRGDATTKLNSYSGKGKGSLDVLFGAPVAHFDGTIVTEMSLEMSQGGKTQAIDTHSAMQMKMKPMGSAKAAK